MQFANGSNCARLFVRDGNSKLLFHSQDEFDAVESHAVIMIQRSAAPTGCASLLPAITTRLARGRDFRIDLLHREPIQTQARRALPRLPQPFGCGRWGHRAHADSFVLTYRTPQEALDNRPLISRQVFRFVNHANPRAYGWLTKSLASPRFMARGTDSFLALSKIYTVTKVQYLPALTLSFRAAETAPHH